ncbi:DUF4870 domain-containing protein [Candidatus Pacearchaeota archaeon]|nr:DUF4870 domain-containing protein [Candidatus Pacearchaeota archaeon]
MAKKKKSKKSNNKVESNTILYAFLATFLSIVGFIIALIAEPKNKYVMYHAKHSLVIFIFAIIAGIINVIVGWIPIIGWLIATGLSIIITILWLISWIFALMGEKRDIPVVTELANKFKF